MDLTLTVADATVATLEKLSDPARQVVVEAWIMPEPTTELCSTDYLHGLGLVQVPVWTVEIEGRDGNGHLMFGPSKTVCRAMCLACAVEAVKSMIADGEIWISLDVTR
jgi:hypothetical protein